MFTQNKKFIFIISLFIAALFVTPVSAKGPALSFDAKGGESFNLVISIDPKDIPNFTTQVELSYPADILEVTSFDYSDGWIPLTQPGYDLVNNTEGIITKTAGYPNGFTVIKDFGTVSFRAKKAGQGIISVSGEYFKADSKKVPIAMVRIDGNLVTVDTNLDLDLTDTNIVLAARRFTTCKDDELFKTSFTDISGHWGHAYIEELECLKIVSGRAKGLFMPDQLINRAELAKIAVETFNIPMEDVTVRPFPDVSITKWYAAYIKAAYDADMIQGYNDGFFRPEQSITRAEALKIILKAAGITVDGSDSALAFSDISSKDWFLNYVSTAKDLGFVKGYNDGTFRPNNKITRAEASKIVVMILGTVDR